MKEFSAIVPLYNFNSNSKWFKIDEGLKIIKTPKILRIFGRTIPFKKFSINYKKRTRGNLADFQKNVMETVEKIITCLRLAKSGVVGYNEMEFKEKNKRETVFSMATLTKPIAFTGKTYTLTKKEKIKVKQLWKKIKKINFNKYKFLKNAIDRFNFSYERGQKVDRLIDYIIAFESLFLREEQELSFKLSLRCAFFLRKKAKERRELYEIIKKAYTLRSKIIHGSYKSKQKITIGTNNYSLVKFMELIESYLRESINKFIKIAEIKTQKEIFKSIEGVVFSNSI